MNFHVRVEQTISGWTGALDRKQRLYVNLKVSSTPQLSLSDSFFLINMGLWANSAVFYAVELTFQKTECVLAEKMMHG